MAGATDIGKAEALAAAPAAAATDKLTLGSQKDPDHKSLKPKSAFHPPVLDPETGYDVNDPLHFLNSVAYRIDQLFTPRDKMGAIPAAVSKLDDAPPAGSLTARPAARVQVVSPRTPTKSPNSSRPSSAKKKGRK